MFLEGKDHPPKECLRSREGPRRLPGSGPASGAQGSRSDPLGEGGSGSQTQGAAEAKPLFQEALGVSRELHDVGKEAAQAPRGDRSGEAEGP